MEIMQTYYRRKKKREGEKGREAGSGKEGRKENKKHRKNHSMQMIDKEPSVEEIITQGEEGIL